MIFFYLAWILTTGLTPLAAEQPIFSFSGGRPTPISLEIFEADRNLSIRIAAGGEKAAQFDVFTLPRPARLVVDLRGIRSALRNVAAPGNSSLISAIRFGSHPDKLRIVFDLRTVVLPAIAVEKKEGALVVELRPGEEGAALATRAPETPAAKPTLVVTATATFQAPAPTPAAATPALPPPTSGQPAAAAIPTPVPAKTRAPTATRTAAPPASASATKTVTLTATATKTISPSPTSTETVTPTRTSTATNTALPTHTATPTHSTAPATKTPTVTPQATPAVQPAVTAAAPVGRQALTGFTFETSAADGAPLIVLNMTQRPVFRLSRKDERTYTLTLTSSALGAEHLRLPQFPPQNFAGFTFISAEQVNANVEVTIGVERNVRLVALAKENSVLLRVAAK